MSYSFGFTGPKSEILDLFDERAAAALETAGAGDPDAQAAVAEQLEDHREALQIQLRHVGLDDVSVSVNVSGHANPGHAPREGWANDASALQVTEASPQTPASA